MTPEERVLLAVIAAIVLIAVALAVILGRESVDREGVRVSTWGRVAAPYVVDGAATSTTAPRPARVHRGNPAGTINGHPCGGDLPPCWRLKIESGGDPDAYNATGCYERRTGYRGCTGKWQCSHSTCSGTGTEAEQDAEARALWNHGAGCHHWSAC